MAWLGFFGAGLLEIVWPVALKHADGFTRLRPSAIGVAAGAARRVIGPVENFQCSAESSRPQPQPVSRIAR